LPLQSNSTCLSASNPITQTPTVFNTTAAITDDVGRNIATFDLGAHSEVTICVLRLFAAGVFDRYPLLKIIIGQMGQTITFVLDRIVSLIQRWQERPIRDFGEVWYNKIWVITSGMFSLAPVSCLVNTMLCDRILFPVGYSFSEKRGREELYGRLKSQWTG
jgi:predicted TIM-barrel fold metal-dependent hydrolase